MWVKLLPIIWCLSLMGGSISGRVTNSVTGAGIAGVIVTAYGPQSREQKAVSDDRGAYRLAGIPDGQYGVSVAEVRGFTPKLGLQLIRVSRDTRLDILMTPLASLRGRVLDQDGKPASGITVNITENNPSLLGEKTITDEKGEFVFADLEPRPYTLAATPKPQPKPQAGAKEVERVVTTYYPSAVDGSQAVQIPVQGVDLFGYDIRLRTALAREVRGVVLDVDGKPAPHARVSIYKLMWGMVTMLRPGISGGLPEAIAAASPVETKEDGTFAFPPVLEGEWKVRAEPMTGSVRGGSVDVSVSTREPEGGDIDHLEIRLAEPFEIRVTTDWGDSPPAETPRLPLIVRSLDALEGATASLPEPGQPQIFRMIAGHFFIIPVPVPGYYVAAVMLGNRDVLGQVVEITGPEPLKTIYKTGGGSVQGTVENCADAIVAVMADATLFGRLGYSARCDANGRFAIADVPPGEYTAVAFQDVGSLFSPSFAAILASSGKRVTVEAGAAAQVDLRLARQ